ncbi:MAG: hypothetical protein FE78DRAFT_144647 [Acidomyces sp. 'richmondensis']|nr:MAG: hypothetical protein FE78DRAFT_144647 [Acidomyces sp. 'richmondensis']
MCELFTDDALADSPYPPQQGAYPTPQPYWQPDYNQHGFNPSSNQGYNHGPPPPSNQGYYAGGSPFPPQSGPICPPSSQFGAPPSVPPAPASPGYVPGQMPSADMSSAADQLRKAMKGFGTDEAALIGILARMSPIEINGVKAAFHARHHRDLVKDVRSETSGHFREGLMGILRGPLDQDCYVAHEAIKGLGTKESALNDVLLGRSNADLNAIKQHYYHTYHKSLESDVKSDLSMKTERMFDMVMAARRNEESAPVIPQEIDRDVQDIYHATEGRSGTDQMTVCHILTSRSNGQIRAIAQAYRQRYHRSLDECIRKEFSGHMEQALMYIVRAAEDPAKHDADLLEDAMRGLGTNDHALIRRIVMIHWEPDRLHQCKAAYKHFYKRELADRIRSETSGDYEKLMLACIGAPPTYRR